MDLILWRHAEAEDGSLTLPDAQRRLTERGEKQARKMALWLSEHLPKATRILVSPAQRTQQTVHPLQRPPPHGRRRAIRLWSPATSPRWAR